MGFKDDSGEPIAAQPSHLVVGPALRATARGLIEAESLASGASNVNHGVVKLIVSPFITSATAWCLLAADGPLKPLILQQRRPVSLTEQDGLDSEGVFNRRQLRIGCDWRGAALHGLWYLIFGSVGA